MTLRKQDLQAPGTYILLMHNTGNLNFGIGALGQASLGTGCYAYIGSALGPGGLFARLRHHCWSGARPRWHIDYLRRQLDISEIWFTAGRNRLECLWADIFDGLPASRIPVPGFGASDCRCAAHLFGFSVRPDPGALRQSKIQRITKHQLILFRESAWS